MKNSFILYTEQKTVIDKLSDEQAGKLIKAIYEYVDTEKCPELDSVLDIIFVPFKQSLDRNGKKYAEVKEKRSKAGKLGMQKRWGQDTNNTTEEITNDITGITNITNVKSVKNEITKITDNVNDNVSVNVNDSVSGSVLKEEIKKEEKTATATTTSNWISEYESNIGLITPMVVEEVESYELSDEVVIEAIKEAVRNGVRMPKYICRILQDYKANNIKTKADVEARRIERSRLHNKDKPTTNATNAYFNPTQMQNEYGDLDRFYANKD